MAVVDEPQDEDAQPALSVVDRWFVEQVDADRSPEQVDADRSPEQVDADRSPELARLGADRDGSVLPPGRSSGRLAASNPYVPFVLVGAIVAALSYAFTRVGSLVLTLAVGIPIGIICLGVVAVSVWRVPKWHSARRRARELVRAEGVPFPRELRWYS